MMDCKKALEESNGDFDKAIEILRKKELIPTGDVNLNPHWELDYQKQLEEHVSRLHNPNVQ